MNGTFRTAVTVDLYVRSLEPSEAPSPQGAVTSRLEWLADTGVIKEFSVQLWGARSSGIPDAHTTDGQAISELLQEFESWADGADYSLEPFFEHDGRAEAFTVEVDAGRTVTLPPTALAEYHGDELSFVAPCADGETVHAVGDRLDALEGFAVDLLESESAVDDS